MYMYQQLRDGATRYCYTTRYPRCGFMQDRKFSMLIHISHTDLDGRMCTSITNTFLRKLYNAETRNPIFVHTRNIRASGRNTVDEDVVNTFLKLIDNSTMINTTKIVLLVTDLGQVSVNDIRQILREKNSKLEESLFSIIVIDHHHSEGIELASNPKDRVWIQPGYSATYLYHQFLLANTIDDRAYIYWKHKEIMDVIVHAVDDHDIGRIYTGWNNTVDIKTTPLSFRLGLYFNSCITNRVIAKFDSMLSYIVYTGHTDNMIQYNHWEITDQNRIMEHVVDHMLYNYRGFLDAIRNEYNELIQNYNRFIFGLEKYASNYSYDLVREALGIDKDVNPKLNVFVDDPENPIKGFTHICSKIGASYPDVLLIGVFPQRMSVEFRCAHVEAGKNDCYMIAKRNGGGGHLRASGCPITEDQLHTICPWMKKGE